MRYKYPLYRIAYRADHVSSWLARVIAGLVAIFLLAATQTSNADGLRVRVSGYEDETQLTTIFATDGVDAYVGTVVGHGHETGWTIPEPTDWDFEGNAIAWTESVEYAYGHWTEYRVELPPSWLGRGVSFSRDGLAWTSFRLFNGTDPETGEQVIPVDEMEWGQRTVPNPDSYVTQQGNRLRLGNWWSDSSKEVFSILTWDNDNAAWPSIWMDIHASTANAYWRWFHPTDDGTATQVVMIVDPDHKLSLFGRSGGLIVLEPETGGITINGKPVVTGGTTNNGGLISDGKSMRIGLGTVTRTTGPGGAGQLVLGRNNRTDAAGLSGVLVVGTGDTSAESGRRNGLRILDDGTVLILPKGDLEMDFTAGPTP
jgi:hypothetical protein